MWASLVCWCADISTLLDSPLRVLQTVETRSLKRIKFWVPQNFLYVAPKQSQNRYGRDFPEVREQSHLRLSNYLEKTSVYCTFREADLAWQILKDFPNNTNSKIAAYKWSQRRITGNGGGSKNQVCLRNESEVVASALAWPLSQLITIIKSGGKVTSVRPLACDTKQQDVGEQRRRQEDKVRLLRNRVWPSFHQRSMRIKHTIPRGEWEWNCGTRLIALMTLSSSCIRHWSDELGLE